MMDDLLSLDLNILDDDFPSFSMDEFSPIESSEIESILNEIEHSANERLLINPFAQIGTGLNGLNNINNTGNGHHNGARNYHHSIKTSKKSKSKVIGTSLLAKPPKKLKKDKNSLLSRNGSTILTANSLLNGNGSSRYTGNVICQAAFRAYFYEEHNYCFNSISKWTANRSLKQMTNDNHSSSIDLNNNLNSLLVNQDKESKLIDSCLTIETKEIVDSNQVLKKKMNSNLANNSTSQASVVPGTLNLISPNNLFNTSDCETVHNLDDYFNISFANSEESSESNRSEEENKVEKETSKFDYEQNESKMMKSEEKNEDCSTSKQTESVIKTIELNENSDAFKTVNVSKSNLTTNITVDIRLPSDDKQKTSIQANTVKNIIIDDINNYNINEINDTDNELISLDEEDEEDDILIETEETEEFILIDEMFGDFPEFDLISNTKKNKNHSSKNSSNKRSNSRSNSFSKSPKAAAGNTGRRTRTISNSYSVRSGSSCSCCSEDMSEEEHHQLPPTSTNKRIETVANKHQPTKSINNVNKSTNRRSTSKLMKADNTFIRKKNNVRFLVHKNTSF